MKNPIAIILLALLASARCIHADPTWPSDVDELEEIMFQLKSFRGRKFADTVSPCTNEASGPGRQNAAEWLRAAFHDMSTANTFFGTGGLDASLQYELDNGENTGPGHRTTLQFMSPFVSRKSSLADLLALGVYISVRSCGGPVVPFRAGRIDAVEKGSTGVPQPQNSAFTFQQQFQRMGFTSEEMIQLTACGHTLGGVHASEFPDLVTTENNNGEAGLDSTVSVFDNNVVTEYLNGTTTNPLVVGPSVRLNKHSDFKVFNVDGNTTMRTLSDPNTFRDTCRSVLQRMIDVVPSGVQLSDPIAPYMVKPVNLQLTLVDAGANLRFSGFIRVKTTNLPAASIKGITISFKDRKGRSNCDYRPCTIMSTMQGVGQGFDDTFAFFPIEAKIPVSSGISSFVITINKADGTSQKFDNNGKKYPLQDAVILQMPQSCLRGSTGALHLVAAVRNDRVSRGTTATISYKVPQSKSPIPLIESVSVIMKKGDCVGGYTFFSADYTIPGGLPYQSRIDVSNGAFSDSFKSVNGIGGTCRDFAHPSACSAISTALGTVKSSTKSTTKAASTSSVSRSTSSRKSTTTSATASLRRRDNIGHYKFVSCWTEAREKRTLSSKHFHADYMTLEHCLAFCDGYDYWGTEYGRECRSFISSTVGNLLIFHRLL